MHGKRLALVNFSKSSIIPSFYLCYHFIFMEIGTKKSSQTADSAIGLDK